jgi:hypothetical protein
MVCCIAISNDKYHDGGNSGQVEILWHMPSSTERRSKRPITQGKIATKSKQCDMRRPACGQCLRLGIECRGYERQRIWKHYIYEPAGSSQEISILPNSLAASAIEQQYLGTWWMNYLPGQRSLPKNLDGFCDGGWTHALQEPSFLSPQLRKILLALAYGISGRQASLIWEADESAKHYLASLTGLSSTLPYAQAQDLITIITTIRLCAIYEVSLLFFLRMRALFDAETILRQFSDKTSMTNLRKAVVGAST